jgi:hypothetical protein
MNVYKYYLLIFIIKKKIQKFTKKIKKKKKKKKKKKERERERNRMKNNFRVSSSEPGLFGDHKITAILPNLPSLVLILYDVLAYCCSSCREAL